MDLGEPDRVEPPAFGVRDLLERLRERVGVGLLIHLAVEFVIPAKFHGPHRGIWSTPAQRVTSHPRVTGGLAMRFGLFGSAAARRGGGEFDSAEGFRDFIDYNVEAEALGFHGTFVVEHHFTGFGQVSATLNLLTWLGARTRRLRLGTAVIVLPWHNPVLLAEQAATLDLLSGGRLDFGIGKGYRYNEFAGFDVPMEEADARFEELLAVLLKAWTSEERFSHHGKYWQFNDIVVEPPSAQKPHPQVWMGAGSERSIRNVAERGFNLLLGQYASPDDVAQSIAVVQGRGRGEGPSLRPDAGRCHPRVLRHRQRAGTRRGAGPAAAEPAAAVEARHDP